MSSHTLIGCVSFLTVVAAAGQPPPASPPQLEIAIRIVQGDGAINSIRMRRGHDPAAQVVDRDGAPVAGATVTFLLPGTGAGGTFQSSGLSLTTMTDDKGMAAAQGLKPNGIAGQFRIRITASWRGQAASATLSQTNAEPMVKSGHGKTIAIVAIIVGGIAGGAAAAAHRGGGSTAPSTGATGGGSTIVSGVPSIGPPH